MKRNLILTGWSKPVYLAAAAAALKAVKGDADVAEEPGEITCVSDVGKGISFRVFLPC